MRTLTDDELDAIAADVRTRPTAETARHIMPLIQHVTELDGRRCNNCYHWLPYNAGHEMAASGECLVYADPESPVKIKGDSVAVLTPFDWGCRGWRERVATKADCQQLRSDG